MDNPMKKIKTRLHAFGTLLVSFYVLAQLWKVYSLLPPGLYFFWDVFCTRITLLLGYGPWLGFKAGGPDSRKNANGNTHSQSQR